MSAEAERRLSPWRVLLAIAVVAVVSVGTVFGFRQWQAAQPATSDKPWFAAYVDVTSTPAYPFDQLGANVSRDAILSFIVSQPSDACTPSWGGAFTLQGAKDRLDLDRRIARLKQQGGSIAVSFGGLKNDELAVKCDDDAKLKAAYKAVVDQYDLSMIDLDLENSGLNDTTAGERRAKAIAALQSERRAAGKQLAVWVTLPVSPKGLSEDGGKAVAILLRAGVDLAGVNAMTMNYSSSLPKGQSLSQAHESALVHTKRQLDALYQQTGLRLNDATLWTKIGATPMLGQNDIASEVFTVKDAEALNKFARSHGLGRMSMWSANRDVPCGSNYVDVNIVSDSCSGLKDAKFSFAETLGKGFTGSLSLSSGLKTPKKSNATVQTPDDPAKSPYQIWSESAAYLEGTKVVWHHNVYQAKWWTQGDMPDSPVLQDWQTPWELIGPVLPGEKPIPQPTLPEGTYPDWSGDATYDTGKRVLFKSVPYQAKWWNQGESPAAASSNPDSSPWTPLTQAQIEAVKKGE